MAKKRDTFKGGKRGGTTRRVVPTRVVDPGLFYALRATVRLVLLVCEEPHKLEGLTGKSLRGKLNTWLTEADAWSSNVRVREQEPGGRQLPGELAPCEGEGSARGEVARTVVLSKRQATQAPGEGFASLEDLK